MPSYKFVSEAIGITAGSECSFCLKTAIKAGDPHYYEESNRKPICVSCGRLIRKTGDEHEAFKQILDAATDFKYVRKLRDAATIMSHAAKVEASRSRKAGETDLTE